LREYSGQIAEGLAGFRVVEQALAVADIAGQTFGDTENGRVRRVNLFPAVE